MQTLLNRYVLTLVLPPALSPLICVSRSGFRDVVRMDMPRTDCVYTEPTPITDEQPMVNGQLPKLRLDYILANDAFLSRYDNLTCTVVADEQSVGYLSDHYPIACSWPQQL